MRIVRIFTALTVSVVCGLAITLGMGIVRFSMVQPEIASVQNPNALDRWADVPGVAFSARDASLTAIAASRENKQDQKLLDAMAEILSVKPMSAGYWLSLAKLRFATGEASEQVMDAWSLSVLTGPNEGNVLPWRGIFGISLWDRASTEVKNRTIAELGAALSRITEQQQSVVRVLVSRKTQEIRQDIRSRLLAEEVSESRLSAIGL
jgi:hypothetical protein